MVFRKIASGGLAGVFLRWASSLRFPFVFVLMSALFVFNLFMPDVFPFVDEIILGLVAILLGNLRKKPGASKGREGD